MKISNGLYFGTGDGIFNNVLLLAPNYVNNTGCDKNSELIINKYNILLIVIDTNFSASQFTMVLNFFYIVSLFV